MSMGLNVLPWGEVSMGRNVREAKCPWDEMSFHGAKCPWGEMSVGRNVYGTKCPSMGRSVHGAKRPDTV